MIFTIIASYVMFCLGYSLYSCILVEDIPTRKKGVLPLIEKFVLGAITAPTDIYERLQ